MFDILKTTAIRSWGHGLNFVLAGKFSSKNGLEKLLNMYGLDIDYSENLLDENIRYVDNDGEDIQSIQVENNNELWLVYNNDSVLLDYIDGGLYVDNKKNFLLVFADGMYTYTNRFAIDLVSGTVGTVEFDENDNVKYEWKYTLRHNDIEMLKSTIEDIGSEELDCEKININRIGLEKLGYPVSI